MNDDNVHAFPVAPSLPENPIRLAARQLGYCDHSAIVLDEHTRSVQCADPKCAAVLDAFDFLRSNARTLQTAWRAYRQVTNEASEIVDRVTALKKEEKRMRAMVKRLQEKTNGAVIDVRGKDRL